MIGERSSRILLHMHEDAQVARFTSKLRTAHKWPIAFFYTIFRIWTLNENATVAFYRALRWVVKGIYLFWAPNIVMPLKFVATAKGTTLFGTYQILCKQHVTGTQKFDSQSKPSALPQVLWMSSLTTCSMQGAALQLGAVLLGFVTTV